MPCYSSIEILLHCYLIKTYISIIMFDFINSKKEESKTIDILKCDIQVPQMMHCINPYSRHGG